VALRRHTLLPPEDCFYALQPTITALFAIGPDASPAFSGPVLGGALGTRRGGLRNRSKLEKVTRIVVIGSGGLGGYFGVRLVKGRADVVFLARGSHLAAMRSQGLSVEGGPEVIDVRPVEATDDPTKMGVADLVIVAVADRLRERTFALFPSRSTTFQMRSDNS
jgi:hypothetical protein